MLDLFLEQDTALFLLLNGLHHQYLDVLMVYISSTTLWIPLYVALLYGLYKQLNNFKHWAIISLLIILSVLVADQITSSLMKPYFKRLRPSHTTSLESKIHLVNQYKGGKYGFASSHAANSFAIATFLYLLMGSRIGFGLFIWAFLVSYSRIYLGVHYPLDILFGSLVGIFSATLLFRFVPNKFLKKPQSL
ncbi:MAG: phosphatase PAP2 family protein [Cytophagales bacterium]|nr:MAG: phosphatase PAP2 family protein [Cytophagales bacterium]